ncbi:hypothetical protein N7447_006230 [Penicillium robsamsonii]|uniref:uncharacterized protein n=1 Tax=Penicillium robsamsonii TaxID=1792511 RepID=UPI002548C280|nr:uncharacterized protein N7447_006230 [Penicillium robsamsonii]KAJ5823890.1 hypothetical protein N7447_006230 [Penicillium robsamsonii]
MSHSALIVSDVDILADVTVNSRHIEIFSLDYDLSAALSALDIRSPLQNMTSSFMPWHMPRTYLEGPLRPATLKPSHYRHQQPHDEPTYGKGTLSSRITGSHRVHLPQKPPSAHAIAAQDKELPQLPINLDASEQDKILHKVNDRLSQCAYDFIPKYQFPVPIEQDKRPVKVPSDREWTEWVHLLKRLATTRRIPARLLYNGQIKQLITVLENSGNVPCCQAPDQLISAAIQAAKTLKNSSTMQFLDCVYIDTEKLILDRHGRRVRFAST